jgi:hypothetical protein
MPRAYERAASRESVLPIGPLKRPSTLAGARRINVVLASLKQ